MLSRTVSSIASPALRPVTFNFTPTAAGPLFAASDSQKRKASAHPPFGRRMWLILVFLVLFPILKAGIDSLTQLTYKDIVQEVEASKFVRHLFSKNTHPADNR